MNKARKIILTLLHAESISIEEADILLEEIGSKSNSQQQLVANYDKFRYDPNPFLQPSYLPVEPQKWTITNNTISGLQDLNFD
tara:strand:+ start:516 stop:764 length:249 start_codon:yes stop_codon:yes gene_type:complete